MHEVVQPDEQLDQARCFMPAVELAARVCAELADWRHRDGTLSHISQPRHEDELQPLRECHRVHPEGAAVVDRFLCQWVRLPDPECAKFRLDQICLSRELGQLDHAGIVGNAHGPRHEPISMRTGSAATRRTPIAGGP